tara:strand:- start:317 stop:439 length:123 start_codon:yes stop_codon:yes gene_type:complete
VPTGLPATHRRLTPSTGLRTALPSLKGLPPKSAGLKVAHN